MRKMIAALQITLDGFTKERERGTDPWVDSWADGIEQIADVDAFVQGAGMHPSYGEYWQKIYDNPELAPLPYQTRPPTDHEVAYARLAAKSVHYVVSTKLQAVAWPPNARIIRDVTELRDMKSGPGKNIYVVGGATLVGTLLNAKLLDELRLIVHPLLLGAGGAGALFERVEGRQALQFVGAKPSKSGRVILTYHCT